MKSKIFYVLGEDAKNGDLLEANPINGVLTVSKNREVIIYKGCIINKHKKKDTCQYCGK